MPKKPKSGKSRLPKHNKTNSLHITASRPAPSIERIFNKADVLDIIKYSAIDRRVIPVCKNIPEKTSAPFYISRKTKGPNSLQYQKNKQVSSTRLLKPRMVHLHLIHPNLFLSDFNWASGLDDGGRWDKTGNIWNQRYGHHNIKTVIHIQSPGANPWTWNSPEYKLVHFNFEMSDNELYTYRKFRNVVHRISVTLSKYLCKGPVLIHCGAGINRSVCVVLEYAMRKCHMNLNEAIQYIEKTKQEVFVDRVWDTLTNKTFRIFMGQIETDILARSQNNP